MRKVLARGVAAAVLAVSLCGFAGSAIGNNAVDNDYFDRHGFAYNISDRDRQTVEYMLERHPEWETGKGTYTNEQGEVVYNGKYIR